MPGRCMRPAVRQEQNTAHLIGRSVEELNSGSHEVAAYLNWWHLPVRTSLMS